MSHHDDISIDCATCIGSGTTACNDCVMSHLLANDDGPIDYVPIRLTVVPRLPSADDLAVDMFRRAGLLDPTDEFVDQQVFDAFDHAGVRTAVPAPVGGGDRDR